MEDFRYWKGLNSVELWKPIFTMKRKEILKVWHDENKNGQNYQVSQNFCQILTW